MDVYCLKALFDHPARTEELETFFLLESISGYSIQEDEDPPRHRLEIYLNSESEAKRIRHLLESRCPFLRDFIVERQEPQDWIAKWKDSLRPMWLTGKFLIEPSIDPQKRIEILRIIPGMAFGTGEHESTRLAAQLLEQYTKPRDRLLDIGCGSGILSLMAAKLGASVMAVDVDEQSITACRENLFLNGCDREVEVRQSDLMANVDGQYNVVVANILFDVLKALLEDEENKIRDFIVEDSKLIFSGLLNKQYGAFDDLLNQHGFSIIERISKHEWMALVAEQQ